MCTPRPPWFMDESYSWDENGQLAYVLAVVGVRGDADAIRPALRRLPRRPGGVLHYRKEDPHRRVELALAIAEMDLEFAVVVCRVERRAERARGLCVRDLAWWAESHGVTELVFESRDEHGNGHDESVLKGLTYRRSGLHWTFRSKEQEPLLWVPDLVAGAVRQRLLGGDGKTAEALGAVEWLEVQQ